MDAIQLLKQVAWPFGFAMWGVIAGVVCDRSALSSAKFLAVSAATVLGAALRGGAPLSLLCCVPTFVVGSRLRVVGLTGGIAVGKSAVSERLSELKVPIVDADKIAHMVLEPNRPAHKRVVQAFSKYPGVVGEDGNIDRSALRKLVFSDRALNRLLKKCTHSAIASEMLRQIFVKSVWEGHPVVVLDAPLLFESKADLLCKQTMVVHCKKETQIKRLAKRDSCSKADCESALSAQMPQDAKMRRAGVLIPNDAGLPELHREVDAVCAALRRESSSHATRVCWPAGLGSAASARCAT